MISVTIKKKKLIYKEPVPLKKILLDYDYNFLKNIFAIRDENNFLSLNSIISNNSQLTIFHKTNFETLQINNFFLSSIQTYSEQ